MMNSHDQSIADVLRGAIRDAQDLVRSEIALAKMEMREEIQRARTAIVALALAAVAALITAVFLLTALAWAIAEVFGWPVWSGFGIVTVVTGIATVGLAYTAQRRLARERRMPLTVDTMKENMEWMRTRTS